MLDGDAGGVVTAALRQLAAAAARADDAVERGVVKDADDSTRHGAVFGRRHALSLKRKQLRADSVKTFASLHTHHVS